MILLSKCPNAMKSRGDRSGDLGTHSKEPRLSIELLFTMSSIVQYRSPDKLLSSVYNSQRYHQAWWSCCGSDCGCWNFCSEQLQVNLPYLTQYRKRILFYKWPYQYQILGTHITSPFCNCHSLLYIYVVSVLRSYLSIMPPFC